MKLQAPGLDTLTRQKKGLLVYVLNGDATIDLPVKITKVHREPIPLPEGGFATMAEALLAPGVGREDYRRVTLISEGDATDYLREEDEFRQRKLRLVSTIDTDSGGVGEPRIAIRSVTFNYPIKKSSSVRRIVATVYDPRRL